MAYRGILERCDECGVCVDECLFLQKYSLTPLGAVLNEEARKGSMAAALDRRATEAPFACTLCGLCDTVCPSQLSPTAMFEELRARLAQDSPAVSACRRFFSDRKYNVYSIYRSANSIDYGDLFKPKAKTVLFPGCSLGTFFPKLTRALYANLAETVPDLGFLMECCQKPIKDLGLQGRYEEATAKLSTKLDEMGVERIVTACPSCLAVLRERFRGREVVSCYSMIHPVENHPLSPEFQKEVQAGGRLKVTVHDACSDRGYAVVGPEVRRLLTRAQGVEMVEMVHNGNNSICCGSGGLVAATDPKLASDFNRARIAEAENSGADLMVAYCATCVNAFRMGGNPSTVETRHALELLLDVREDYDAVALKIGELFVSGPKKDFYERLVQNSP